MADVLLIEGCDFESYPPGGQLSFAKQMVKVYGGRLALVGLAINDEPLGVWMQKRFGDLSVPFYAVARRRPSPRRPTIPARLSWYCQLRLHRRGILSLGIRNVFVEAPEVLLGVSDWPWNSLCFRFAGVTNLMTFSRYAWGPPFAPLFDRLMFKKLKRADTILASADDQRIDELVSRSHGRIQRSR